MRDRLSAAKAANDDPWISERINVLDQNAQLMECIYGVLNESAGYKADMDGARKDRMRDLISRARENDVVANDDIRCKVLQSLMPHVSSVLGPDEAAKYDRVAVVVQE
jgi:hypothetical protein